MTVVDAVFYGFAGVTLASAAVVALSGNILRSVFSLLLALAGAAGLYVLLGQDFLAGVQVLVYVGGVLVLALFAIMMTRRISTIEVSNESIGTLRAAVVCALLFTSLSACILSVDWQGLGNALRDLPEAEPTTARIGEAFLREYLLPFEVVSVLLLVALMGAAMIVKKTIDEEEGTDA